jgi:hypothetical protein
MPARKFEETSNKNLLPERDHLQRSRDRGITSRIEIAELGQSEPAENRGENLQSKNFKLKTNWF